MTAAQGLTVQSREEEEAPVRVKSRCAGRNWQAESASNKMTGNTRRFIKLTVMVPLLGLFAFPTAKYPSLHEETLPYQSAFNMT